MGKSESTPSALWTIMPVMPIMAARPLLRSALSLNFFTSGSSYLGSGQTDHSSELPAALTSTTP